MLVRVDVIERQPGRGEGGELRRDLGRELAARRRQEEHRRAGRRHIVAKAAASVDEAGNLLGRQDRRAVDEDEVEADAEVGQALGPRHRVGGGGRADHQAGGGQDAARVGDLDRLVDRDVVAEVVGGDDEALHPRKTKNAPPAIRAKPIPWFHDGC